MGKFMNITTMESHLDRIVQWLLWRWEWKVSLQGRWGNTKETSWLIILGTQKNTNIYRLKICNGYELTNAVHLKHIIISNSIHHRWGMILCSYSKEYQYWDCYIFNSAKLANFGQHKKHIHLARWGSTTTKTGEVLLFWKEVHRRDVAGSSHTQKFPMLRFSTIVDLRPTSLPGNTAIYIISREGLEG